MNETLSIITDTVNSTIAAIRSINKLTLMIIDYELFTSWRLWTIEMYATSACQIAMFIISTLAVAGAT